MKKQSKTTVGVRDTFEGAVRLRAILREEYLKSIHQNPDKKFVERAERTLLNRIYNPVSGMTSEQEQLLETYEDLCGLIANLSKYL